MKKSATSFQNFGKIREYIRSTFVYNENNIFIDDETLFKSSLMVPIF